MTEHMLALPPGYRLQEYEILRVLGVGGFGITYLCFDNNLDQARAIKEYLPNDWAIRLPDNTVKWKATESKEDFEAGLKSFLDEARRLAKFKHDNIVKVHRSFSELGTAYIVMEYAEGETLSSILDQKGTLNEKELKSVLMPILNGLEEVHKVLIHRDIKPGNIIIRDADESPVLLDFGSARQTAGSKSKSMTAIVTAGFAPIEQYSTQGNQGPWTDIYALGCLCYRALSGESPREAPLRIRNDPLVPISQLCKGKADPHFLAAIDWAMKVYEEERPQDISSWRAALLEGKQTPTTAPTPASAAATASAKVDNTNATVKPKKRFPVLMSIVLLILAGVGVAVLLPSFVEPENTQEPTVTPIAMNETEDATVTSETEDPPPEAVVVAPPVTPDPEPVITEPAEVEVAPAQPRNQVEMPPTVTDLIANASPAPNVSGAGQVFRDRLTDGSLGPVMVTLPMGTFEMGHSLGNGEPDEQPAHIVVQATPFAMGKYEITFEEFDNFATALGITVPDDAGWGRSNQPVLNINWYDAAAYARWLSEQTGEIYRLPSEAEWEYAGRAGSASSYAWGGSVGEAMANCVGCAASSRNAPAPVGSFPVNAFGLHDMQGNVWEWVEDCARDSYLGAPIDGSVWIGDEVCSRILRGGSWQSSPNQLRSSFRNWYPSADQDNTVGFRLVREIRQ